MKPWRHSLGRPAQAVHLLLDPAADEARRGLLLEGFRALLARLDWRAHIYVSDGADGADLRSTQSVIRIVARFLEEQELATFHLHPVVRLPAGDAGETAAWGRLLSVARPFQERAYELQGETRLHIFPIVVPDPAVSVETALETAHFLRARLANPSFHLASENPNELVERVGDDEARFFLDAEATGLAGQLWASHVVESGLERLEGDPSALLNPCAPHLVVDESRGEAYACFAQWRAGEGGVPWPETPVSEARLPAAPDGAGCPPCLARSLTSMQLNLEANRRKAEGRRLAFAVALALAEQGNHDRGAKLAHMAFDMAESEGDRAAARLHEGLCLLGARRLEEADRALVAAGEHAAAPGLVSYHRGRVQFVWRDWIEALDRFEEALASGCDDVPVEDMCFDMALCHINLEEYADARPYLDRCVGPDRDMAPVVFYQGVCDLGEGHASTAMGRFEEALRLEPSEEDVGRVLFYLGTCLKELERFDDAIVALERAAKADPEDLASHNLLGFCYYKTKRHEEAVSCFRRAVEIDPRSGIDWANLGSNLRDLGRTDEAVAMYEKALTLDPTLGFARVNLIELTRGR